MLYFFKKFLLKTLAFLCFPIFFFLGMLLALFARYFLPASTKSPSLVWGVTPIISNAYWSKAMSIMGYQSHTFTNGFYSTINKRSDWDLILQERYGKYTPNFVKILFAFFESMFKYNIYFISSDGFFLGGTPYWWLENILLKIAGKKIVLLPYGSDSYVYRRIRSLDTIHALMISYPQAARKQEWIATRVEYWCRNADVVIPHFMGPDGFGRWDILVPNIFALDLSLWTSSTKKSTANGHNGSVVIVHAPNHRGFKGTEFIIDSIEQLKSEGLNIEFLLIEKKQNDEVREILTQKADILIEQIIATAYALNAIEGMACSLPVISNLEDDALFRPFRRWSYFLECPIVSASPETLTDVLRKLVTRPELRHQLGRAGREYVEKYHGLDFAQHMFSAVIEHLYGRMDAHTLLNLYNPRTSEYCKRRPKVKHPLVNNRIVD